MGQTKTAKLRRRAERAGLIAPAIDRVLWRRKPQTQIVMNKKAEQRRTQCRRNEGSREGADFFAFRNGRKCAPIRFRRTPAP
ncbi:hypothetical protein ACF3MZ_16300 [Paenibacillaceae bacterium WGS1546]|uniref:hypothetical protein n=1 Tax=Cohnella sp. WGS1546 TaxID=3366810 RepID=UPI00372D19E7